MSNAVELTDVAWRHVGLGSALGTVARQGWRQARRERGWDRARVLWCALRLLPHAFAASRMLATSRLAQMLACGAHGDPLLSLHHRHFLWRDQPIAHRLSCLAHHLMAEERDASEDYLAQVYGPGLCLWSRASADAQLRLMLRSERRDRHEGPLSAVLEVDGEVMHVMSMAWVPANALQLPGPAMRTIPLVTRNQCLRPNGRAMATYRSVFPQVAAQYLCLAALQALVQARGHEQLAGVPHERQIAYQPRHLAGFRHSYSDFWESLSGERRGLAYLMSLPTPRTPIDSIPAKHRRRARERRELSAEVVASSRLVLRPLLRGEVRTDQGQASG